MKKWRGSCVSLAGWLLLLPFICFISLSYPMLKLASAGYAASAVVAMLIADIMITVVLHYMLLKVEIGDGWIEKRGLFGRTRIELIPDIRIRYDIVTVESAAGSVRTLAFSRRSKKPHQKIVLTIKLGGHRIRLTNSVRRVHEIADYLRRFEMKAILPVMQEVIADGGAIDAGSVRVSEGKFTVRGRQFTAWPSMLTVSERRIVFQFDGLEPRETSVSYPSVWNPHALVALLTDGSLDPRPEDAEQSS